MNSKRGFCRVAAFALCASSAFAADTSAPPSFYKDILPILQENCQTCHRPLGMNAGGMIAPMSFMTFDEVRPWAKSMAKQAQQRTMPPWHAGPDFHEVFSNERTLTDDEISTVLRWVKTGARRGREEDAPQETIFTEDLSDGWSIGEPDLVISMDPFFVDDDIDDLNITFSTVLTDQELSRDRWVQAIEYKAGSEIVHHICNSAVPPGLDADDFTLTERIGLGCIAPGTDPRFMPDEFGTRLLKNATIRWGMHYHKETGPGTGMWDQSQMAFIFSKTPVKHDVKFDIIQSGNGWEVPPMHGNWMVGAGRTFAEPTTILSLLPHMHFRGTAAEYRLFYPDGRDELILSVPKYDYNWQTIYRFDEPKEVPTGTRIEVTMWYDNSPEKMDAMNLISNRPISFGLPTTEEMMNGWIGYANTEPKDFDLRGDSDD